VASRLFWHVPAWFNGLPSATGGADFVWDATGQIVIPLLETETASQSIAPDNYWVERIVGQYHMTLRDTIGEITPAFIHHRVYVMPADEVGVDTRDLLEKDDADTSFLMHKVEYGDDNLNGVVKGNWQELESLTLQPLISRNGGFDIRVGRKVEAGEALIWHSQQAISAFVTSGGINMWCRVLLRQLG